MCNNQGHYKLQLEKQRKTGSLCITQVNTAEISTYEMKPYIILPQAIFKSTINLTSSHFYMAAKKRLIIHGMNWDSPGVSNLTLALIYSCSCNTEVCLLAVGRAEVTPGCWADRPSFQTTTECSFHRPPAVVSHT